MPKLGQAGILRATLPGILVYLSFTLSLCLQLGTALQGEDNYSVCTLTRFN